MADKTLLDLPILASGDIDNSDVLHAIDISDNLDKQTTTGFLAEFILQRSAFNIATISTTPIWEQVKSDNIADGKRMFIETSTDRHRFGISNDAKTSSKYFLEAIRTGNTLTQTILRGDTVTLAGNTSVSGTLGVTGLTSLSTLSTTGLATLNSASVTGALGVGGLLTVSSSGITSSSSRIDLLKGVQIGTGTAEGNLTLKQNGSDTIEGGAYIKLRNNDASDQIVTQISADGHEDKWFWNGSSWSLRERITQTGRHIIGNSGTDNGDDLLQVGSDDDISASFGRGKLGFAGASGDFYIAHQDSFTSLNYGLRFDADGDIRVNAKTGQTVSLCNNNSILATFSGTQIDLLKPVVIQGSLGNIETVSTGNFLNFTRAGDNYITATETGGRLNISSDTITKFRVSATEIIDISSSQIDLLQPVEALSGIKTDNTTLKTKVIEIGDWDMVNDTIKTITHGISDFTKIRSVATIIRPDSDQTQLYKPLNTLQDPFGGSIEGGVNNITSTSIQLTRLDTGFFDSTNYNETSYNRGWITITYEA